MKVFNERGYIFIAFALLLPLFILFMSLVLELGRGFTRQTELQNIADAAALAGAMQIEDQNVFHLVSDCPEDATEEKSPSSVVEATTKSMQANGLVVAEDPPKLMKTDSAYYYCVKISDHVPLTLARTFLPDSFMPEGLPVSALAWAKAEMKSDVDNGQLYYQLYSIGWDQTPQLMADIRDALYNNAKIGNSRAEQSSNGINYNYSVDKNGNVSMSRTETVDTNEVGKAGSRLGTYKYLFVDFRPDIEMSVDKGILKDGIRYFPFDNIDNSSDISADDWKNLSYSNVKLNNISGATSRKNLIDGLISTYGISQETAEEILATRIENVVIFNDLHKVRKKTREDLENWEIGKLNDKNDTLAQKEKAIAASTGNEAFGQLVVRDVNNKIVEADPLLVRIESEDTRRIHSYSSEKTFYTSSVRTLTLKIEVDNTARENRPLIIYYFGPQDSDENVNGGRTSQPVTLELNANFKGMLFAPYSPVIIKSNGHKIQGLVVGDHFIDKDGSRLNYTGEVLNQKLGFSSGSVTFNDFDMLNLPEKVKNASNVFLTSKQAKQIK